VSARVRSLAALALACAVLLAACGTTSPPEPGALDRCLRTDVPNFVPVERDTPPWLVKRLGDDGLRRAETVLVFAPFDPFFGEEVGDNAIVGPSPAAFAYYATAAEARRAWGERLYEHNGDRRRGRLLVLFQEKPAPRHRAAVEACL